MTSPDAPTPSRAAPGRDRVVVAGVAVAGVLLAVAVVALVLLVALRGDDDPGGRTAAPSPTPAPTTAAPTATPTPSAPVPPPPPSPTTPPPPPGPREVSAFSLKVGDCLPAEPAEAASVRVQVVPCEVPHTAEVFAVFALPGAVDAPFPGEAAANDLAISGCVERFRPYVGIPYEDSAFSYFFYKPDQTTWDTLDDRMVTCVLTGDARAATAKDSRT